VFFKTILQNSLDGGDISFNLLIFAFKSLMLNMSIEELKIFYEENYQSLIDMLLIGLKE